MRYLNFFGGRIRRSLVRVSQSVTATATPQLGKPVPEVVGMAETFTFGLKNRASYASGFSVRTVPSTGVVYDSATGLFTVTPSAGGTLQVQVFVTEAGKTESSGATTTAVTVVEPDFDATGLQAWHSVFKPGGYKSATINGHTVVSKFKDLTGNGYDHMQGSFEFAPLLVGSGTSLGLSIPGRRFRHLTQNTTNINLTDGTLTATGGGPVFVSGEAGETVTLSSSTTMPTGLTANTVYYIGAISGNTFKLFTTRNNAINNVSPVIPSAAGSGTLTITMENRTRFMRSLALGGYNVSGQHNPTAPLAGYLTNVSQWSVFFLITPDTFSVLTGSQNRVLEALSRNANEAVGSSSSLSGGRYAAAVNQTNQVRGYAQVNDSTNNSYTGNVSVLTAGSRVVVEFVFDLTATTSQLRVYRDGSVQVINGSASAIDGTAAGSLANTTALARFLANGHDPNGTSALPLAGTISEQITVARSGGVTSGQRTSIVNALLARTA